MYGGARHSITASSVGVVPLNQDERRTLLSGIDTKVVLVALGELQAELDAAMLSGSDTLPHEAMRIVDAEHYEPVRRLLADGHRLAPPQTLVRLMREVIEAGEGPRAGISTDDALLHLLLSVNEDHDDAADWAAPFRGMDTRDVNLKMQEMPADELLALANGAAVGEAASMMFNASRLPEYMKCMVSEFWFSPWASRAGDSLGATPADAFFTATGVSMDNFLLAGDLIASAVRGGRAAIDLNELKSRGVTDAVTDYIKQHMVRELDEFRTLSARDRDRGDVRAQRFTFTRFPFLAIDGDRVLALRAQWAMDRFFGTVLEHDVVQGFEDRGDRASVRKFKTAVTHQFEQVVGGMVRRIAGHSNAFASVVDESEMQSAWTFKKGQTPSVCDWMVPAGDRLVWLLDATHRPLLARLAEGTGDGQDFADNLSAFLTDGKVLQFESVTDRLIEHGWAGTAFGEALIAPFVVVPDDGLPSTPLSMMLVGQSAQELVARYPGTMLVPAVVTPVDLMLLEGLAETPGVRVADLICQWRRVGLMSLQQYIEACGVKYRPCPRHMFTRAAELDARIRASARA